VTFSSREREQAERIIRDKASQVRELVSTGPGQIERIDLHRLVSHFGITLSYEPYRCARTPSMLTRRQLGPILAEYRPVTKEIRVDPNLSADLLPFHVCHELAHHCLGHGDLLMRFDALPDLVRAELEWEADLFAIEVLCPARQLRRFLRERSPIATIATSREAANHFGVTTGLILKQYVLGATTRPAALVTLGYFRADRRSADPCQVSVRVVMSRNWATIDQDDRSQFALDVYNDGLGASGRAAIQNGAGLSSVRQLVEQRFGGCGEPYRTQSSNVLYVLLHQSRPLGQTLALAEVDYAA